MRKPSYTPSLGLINIACCLVNIVCLAIGSEASAFSQAMLAISSICWTLVAIIKDAQL